MRILLVNTNVSQSARNGAPVTPAPAGLISLAGVLRRANHEVRIVQLFSHVLNQDEGDLPLLRTETAGVLKSFDPELIGISARNVGAARRPANPIHLLEYFSVFYDARVVRAFRMQSKAAIVMGGTAFSLEPALYMKCAQPDFGLIGEAEESLPALVEAMATGDGFTGIPGLVRELADITTALAGRGRPADLAEIGVGACSAVEDFREWYYKDRGFALIQTKRGCPFKCIYCTTPFLEGCSYRYRPMAQVIDEMKAYRTAWGVRHFFIGDATFNHPLDHALEVCDALIHSGIQAQWTTEVTPLGVNDALCMAMKRAGCIGVTLGAEAFSDAVLNSYGKPYGVTDILHAAEMLSRHAIPFECCAIIGGPGETAETFARGMSFCEEHLRNVVIRFFDGMIVTSRTPSFDIAAREGVIDPARRYEDIVLGSDFKSIRRFEYFFPHVREGRPVLLSSLTARCRGPRWLQTSKDFMPDPATGEFAMLPEISVGHNDRPWWLNLHRQAEKV